MGCAQSSAHGHDASPAKGSSGVEKMMGSEQSTTSPWSSCSWVSEGLAKEALTCLEQGEVQMPCLPGDIALCGQLAPEKVAHVAPMFKSWININGDNDPWFFSKIIEEAGVQCVEARPFPGPPQMPLESEVEEALKALDTLPKPMMIQCTNRCCCHDSAMQCRGSALLLLWLASKRGYNVHMTKQLALDTGLEFWKSSKTSLLGEWLFARLPCHDARVVQRPAEGLILVQLFDSVSSSFTYLLGCEETKAAVLIDPVLSKIRRDQDLITSLGLKLQFVLNSHCHEDRVSSGGRICSESAHVRSVISKASGADANLLLDDGGMVAFGNFSLKALMTPGHSEGCMSLLLSTPDGKGFVFTGDSLLIRSCGRTDMPQGSPGKLYDVVHSKLFTLPGDTIVFPAHDFHGRNASTIEEERRLNPYLSGTRDEFIHLMAAEARPLPKSSTSVIEENLRSGVADLWQQSGHTC